MRKYPKYKASGVDWLGEIPSDWQCGPLMFRLKSNDGGIWGELAPDNLGTMVLRSTEITIDGNYEINEPAYIKLLKEDIEKYKLRVGDLLITKSSGSEQHIGKTALTTIEIENLVCCYSNFMQRLRPNSMCLPKFLHYYLNSDVSRKQYHYNNKSSIGLGNLGKEVLASIYFPFLSLPEQHAIVRFLDFKTGQIDSFIANRQKQIELLKEQKQYVLDKRITEGIYPEKGFQKIVHPYIKQIPVGWEFKKLAFLSKITRLAGYEYTLLWEPQENGEVIALRGQNVGFNELKDIENAERISKELSLRLNRSKLYKGDIVFPCVGTVGKAVLIEEDNKYHINQNIAKITPKNEIDGLFLSLLLNSYYAYHQIIHFNTSDAQPNVLVRDLRRFMIPTPPYEEQKEIAGVIIKELNTLNTIISKYQKQIDLMQEYRTSLISQTVTGKIDVREWQPKNQMTP